MSKAKETSIETTLVYDKFANVYDEETADFWKRFPCDFLKQFAVHTRTEGKVLDIGSGPGRDALILEKYGLRIICADASTEMVKLSRKRGLESVRADFNALPFPDGSFDGIWSYTSLLHVRKQKIGKALAEVKRALTPRGTFGLGLIEGKGEGERTSSHINEPRWFSYYTKEEAETLLALHGFEVAYFGQITPGNRNYLHFIAKKK